MDNGNNEIKFVEEKARELVYYLLANDTPFFKKLIPEIKAMDSNSFENLFKATPFKSENNKDGYDYQVQNKKSFERLLDKFDNFNVILWAWYLDQKYYEYLKKLWRNYISIESLQKRSDNEFEFEKFLENYDIDYKKWPQNIKNDFKIQINNTKKTEIWEDKKKNEYKIEVFELKILMEQLKEFKNKIKDEPGMEIYVENTDNLIEKLKTLIYDLYKILKKNFFNEETKEKGENIGPLTSLVAIFQSLVFPKNNFVEFLYNAVSFLNLGWSVYDYIQASKALKKIKNDIKGYKKELKEINNKFNEHKQELGILPDDSKESIKLIKEIFTLIRQDYQQLDNLIKKIEESIKTTKKYKEKSKIGLISSGILGVAGIAVGIFVRNGKPLWYGASVVSNVVSAICHGSTINESNKIIEELRKVDNDASEQKKKFEEEINKILNFLDSLKGNYPKYK